MTRAIRRAVLAFALAIGLWPAMPLGAQERKLSAAEIEDKLIGNTIQGLWDGQPYRQFFDGSGRTIFVEDGRQPSMGRWKADAEKDQYCSSWQSSRSACYEVLDGGPNAIIWALPGSGKKFPATVLQGDQLSTVVQADPVF
jgi:hypothetical protein